MNLTTIALIVGLFALLAFWGRLRRQEPSPPPLPPIPPSKKERPDEAHRRLKTRIYFARDNARLVSKAASELAQLGKTTGYESITDIWAVDQQKSEPSVFVNGAEQVNAILAGQANADEVMAWINMMPLPEVSSSLSEMVAEWDRANDAIDTLEQKFEDPDRMASVHQQLEERLRDMVQPWQEHAWSLTMQLADDQVRHGGDAETVADSVLSIIRHNEGLYGWWNYATPAVRARADAGSLLWLIVLLERQGDPYTELGRSKCEAYLAHKNARVRQAFFKAIDYEYDMHSDEAPSEKVREIREIWSKARSVMNEQSNGNVSGKP